MGSKREGFGASPEPAGGATMPRLAPLDWTFGSLAEPREVRMLRKALLAVVLGVLLTGCHANPKFVCAPAKPAACPLPLCDAKPQPGRSFSNLVLEGGGVKGVAYPGAVQVLQGEEILPKIDKVAGTSAGSIAAALIALGYTPE